MAHTNRFPPGGRSGDLQTTGLKGYHSAHGGGSEILFGILN